MESDRPLRADARQNQDRILQVAADAFARPGSDTTMKAIAAAAGVGIGTLYRRFPTREDLIEAIYRTQTTALCDWAAELAVSHPPAEAIRVWLEGFVNYMLVKNGMSEALPAILDSRGTLRASSRRHLDEAVETLLAAGRASGDIRAVPSWDVVMSIGGITLIAGHEHQRALASRLIDIVLSGIRTSGTRT